MTTGKHYTILIGNDDFPKELWLATLFCTTNEVKDLEDILQDIKHGIFLKRADVKLPIQCIYIKTTKIHKISEKDNMILIYYSVHELIIHTNISYLAANNTTINKFSISTELLNYFFEDALGTYRAQKIILILDYYDTGTVGNVKVRSSNNTRLHMTSQSTARSTYIFTLYTNIQTVAEKEKKITGITTKPLFEWRKAGKADANHYSLITANKIYAYIYYKVVLKIHLKRDKWICNITDEFFIAQTILQSGPLYEQSDDSISFSKPAINLDSKIFAPINLLLASILLVILGKRRTENKNRSNGYFLDFKQPQTILAS